MLLEKLLSINFLSFKAGHALVGYAILAGHTFIGYGGFQLEFVSIS